MKKLIIIIMALCLGCATAGIKEHKESGRERVDDYNHYLVGSRIEVYVFEYHNSGKDYLVFVNNVGGIEVIELEDDEKEK